MKPRLTLGTQKFVDDLAAQNSAPLYTLTPDQARQVLISAQSTEIDKPDVDIQDFDVPMGSGKVSTRIIRPKMTDEAKLPIIFYIHGGGWIMGNKLTHDRMVRKLAVGAKAAVVYPEYTNSPQAQYPVITDQCWAVLEYIVKECDKYNLDGTRLAVAGDSAGGNMATVMAIMAKEKGGPKIGYQALFYPVTDYSFDTQSYTDFADGPWLTKKAMEWFWKAYVPDASMANDIHISPLRATTEQLKDMPPALIITDENDVLRDEGEAYGHKLMEAGVKVASVRILGTHHDFMMLNGLAHTTPTKEAFRIAAVNLRKALHQNCGEKCWGDKAEGSMGRHAHHQHHHHDHGQGQGHGKMGGACHRKPEPVA